VKQAAGKQPVPPLSQRTPDSDWSDVEPAYRYGAGARAQYGREYSEWDDRVESRLRADWDEARNGGTWDHVKAAVRRGWERVKN